MPVPNFSTSNNFLYRFAADMMLYLEKHALKNRLHDEKEATDYFLDNLDDHHAHATIVAIDQKGVFRAHVGCAVSAVTTQNLTFSSKN